MVDWIADFYRSGRLEWLLESGREALLITTFTTIFLASRNIRIPGLRLISIGLMVVFVEQMMHAAHHLSHMLPREAALAVSWIGWGISATGGIHLLIHLAEARGALEGRSDV